MTKTMKHSLVSAATLIIVAVVSVGLLMLAYAFMPKYEAKLDLETVTLLNGISPTGVDAQTAFDEGYFVVADVKLDDFNSSNGTPPNDIVLAAYVAEKGDNAGTVFVETKTSGFDQGIRIMTVLKDGKFVDIVLRANNESIVAGGGPGPDLFTSTTFAKLKDALVGQDVGNINKGTVETSTGATATYSIEGVVKNINLSIQLYNTIKGGL